jgi:hypothetical protein
MRPCHPDELPAQRPRDRLPQRRLADSGRADQRQHRTRAAAADRVGPAPVAPGPDGQELDQPLLDVVEAGVVGVEDPAGLHEVGRVLGGVVPRHVEDRVEPGPDPPGLRALVRGPLELPDLGQRGLADVLGQVRRLDPGPVVGLAVGVVLAELLADRGELLAQQELALLGLHPLADVVRDLLRDLLLGDVRLRPLQQLLQPGGHVGLGEQLGLVRDVQPGRPAGQVGELPGVGGLLHRVDDLPGPPLLQDADHQRLVLGSQLVGAPGGLTGLDRLDLHPQGGAGAGDPAADAGAALAAHHRGPVTVGQAADLFQDGDHTERAVPPVQAWHDEDPSAVVVLRVPTRRRGVDGGAGVGGVEADRDHHPGQDHGVVEGQDRERQHVTHARSNSGEPGLLPKVERCPLRANTRSAGPRPGHQRGPPPWTSITAGFTSTM